MNELDKSALINNECTIKTKIIVDDGTFLTESDYVLSWDYEDFRYVPNQGFLGQFVERVVNGNLKNVDDSFTLENKVIELQFAVVRNDGTETWYSLGHFIVNNPTDDNVKDNTSFKAVDYTKYFETPYVDKVAYPTTAGALAYSVCKQAKTSLGNFQASLTKDTTINSSKQYFTYDSTKDVYNLVVEPSASNLSKYYEINECFTNHDFVIEANQFVNNETCRAVIKAISMLAYSWVRIGWDDKCYLDFEVNTEIENDNIITNDDYYDLTTKNDYFGEVNKVIIGMKDVDGENTTLVDNNSNATENFEITLWDNPLTYNQELREKAIVKANKLFGLKYKPVEMTTVGHPWLIGNELLSVVDMEGNTILTYPFDRTISYSGHIKTKIKSQAMSKTDTKYAYEGRLNNLGKSIKNTQIIVDKANQRIDAVVQTQEDLSDSLIPLATSNGVELKLEKSAGEPLVEFELDGNSYQETRSGSNLFDASKIANKNIVVKDNGKNIIMPLDTTGNGYVTTNSTLKELCPNLKVGDVVVLHFDRNYGTLNPCIYLDTVGLLWYRGENNKQTITQEKLNSKVSLYGNRYMDGETEQIILQEFRINLNTLQDWETHGSMPSSDYPSEVVSVEGYNLIPVTLDALKISNYLGTWDGNVYTYNGVTFTVNEDMSVTIGGTYSSRAYFYYNNGGYYSMPTGTYKMSGCPSGGGSGTYRIIVDIKNGGSYVSGVTNEEGDTTLDLSSYSTPEINTYIDILSSEGIGKTFYPMVRPSNIMNDNYLPYQNIGLKDVGKNINIPFTHTKDFLNIEDNIIQLNGTIPSNGAQSTAFVLTKKYVAANYVDYVNISKVNNVLKAGTYTISIEYVSGTIDDVSKLDFAYRLDKSEVTPAPIYTIGKFDIANNVLKISKTFTLLEDTPFCALCSIHRKDEHVATNFKFRVQLEENLIATEYEPYKEEITQIDLQGNFIGRLSDTAKDKLYLKDGHLFLEKKVGKYTFSGNEDFTYESDISRIYVSLSTLGINTKIPDNELTIPALLNEKFIASSFFDLYRKIKDNCIGISLGGSLSIRSSLFVDKQTAIDIITNTNLYYELAEPQVIDLGEYSLNTLSGNSIIELLSRLETDMYCKYIRDVDGLDVFQTKENMKEYYNKYETDSRISIETETITSQVESIASLVDNNGEEIEKLNNRVTEEITSTQAQIEVVQSKVNNGVETLKNSLVTININGIQVSTNLSKISTLITNDSFKIIPTGNPDEPLAFFGYDEEEGRSKAEMDNLTVTNYFTAGYHRTEGFEDEETNEPRTGWFYVGGNI